MYVLNSFSLKMVSTVVSTKGSCVSHLLMASKLCIELGVDFAIKRNVVFLSFSLCCCMWARCVATSVISSLQTTTISVALLLQNTRMRRSIRVSPLICTNGFGTVMPSLASLEPFPAAIMAYFIACFSTQWVLLLFYWKHKDTSFKWKTRTEYLFFCYNNSKIFYIVVCAVCVL